MFQTGQIKLFVSKLCSWAFYSLIALLISNNLFSADLVEQNFRKYNTIDNINFHSLPSNYNYRATRSIIRDHKGFMWFGTENGLVRFDGINQKVYEHNSNDPRSIHYNTVNALAEDKNHKLWIGTSKGLSFYNRQNDNFERADTSSQEAALLNQSYISSISVGNDSLFWIGTFSQGLFSLNIKTQQSKRYTLSPEAGTNTNITCIQVDGGKQLWIGTQSGLVLFDIETSQSLWFCNDKENTQSISNNNITSIQKDKFGNIWVSTQDSGLNKVIKSGNLIHFERMNGFSSHVRILSNAINKLFADDEGYLWIGTENDGLHLLNIKTGSVEVYTHEIGNDKSIGSNSVWSIYRDIEGRIWIGSYNKGISVYDSFYSKFESFQINPYSRGGLINNDVRGFCESQDGRIWIATDGGGICRFDLQSRTYDKVIHSANTNTTLTSNSIQTIICDTENTIWLGSWGGGIDRLTHNGEFIRNYKIENGNGVGNNKIRIIYQDLKGNIWAGTNGSGLFLYNKNINEFEPFVYQDILNNDRAYIIAICSDSDNKLWVGTLAGLIVFELDQNTTVLTAKRYTSENSALSINAINTLSIDSQKNIWIGTTNGGLNVFNPNNKSFKIWHKSDGLPSDNISGIMEDNEGNIWISTNNGISKINRSTFEISSFSISDGLNSNEFYSKSCYKTKNGTLLFGSGKGFNLIQPEKIKTNHYIPRVLLTELRINNNPVSIAAELSPLKKQLSETDTLILNYKQTSFSIDFVAFNYTRPSRNQFAYKLEGYDKDWNYIGTKNTAHYTKVKPGKYIFKVKGANNDGVWNEQATSLYIIIQPPFWKTKWAYILYLLTFFSIMIILFWIWQEQIHINNQLKLEKLAKRREHELNKKNLEFFTNISHEFRTPLTLIIGPVEAMLESAPKKMVEQIEVIQRNAQRLLALTNNLLDLRKLEDGGMQLQISETDIVKSTGAIIAFFSMYIEKQNINLSVSYPKTETMFYFDNEKYTTVLFNLLSNAIKYTPREGSIQIVIKHQHSNKHLEISVINTGIGIKPFDLPFIFEKFYQTNSGRKQKQFGSGIGLALCKGLVELHGGKIWANSIPEQETNFTFTIPTDKSIYKSGDFLAEQSEITNREFFIDDYEPEQNSQIEGVPNDERPVLLIVEDNSDLRLFLKRELEKFYTIVLASNGKEGFEKANETIPDLIISDIVMPVMNGIDLCNAIKNDVRTSHIPFVMLTAKTTMNEQIEGIDTGADAYITKPFHLKLLLTQIANLIQSRKELYAQFSQDVYILARKQANNEVDRVFLQKTVDFILENITDSKLDIEVLAQIHNMSHRNFYRKIKALTDNTVVEFIKIVRLKQALVLMQTQQHNLTEISYMTGFTSPSYFTKNFREFYGKPPSDYLKV